MGMNGAKVIGERERGSYRGDGWVAVRRRARRKCNEEEKKIERRKLGAEISVRGRVLLLGNVA